MAGGPLYPCSRGWPSNGRIFPRIHVGATNSRQDEGYGIEGSLGADSTLELRFEAPQVLPSGTPKLRWIALANATSGNAVINPSWASCAVGAGENPDTISLTAEGNTTLTWSSGDNDDYLESKITLDADTVVADEMIVMNILHVSASWTLTVVCVERFSIIWE